MWKCKQHQPIPSQTAFGVSSHRVTLIKTPDIHTLDAVDVRLSAQRVSTVTFVVLLTSSLASQAPFFLVPSSAVCFLYNLVMHTIL